VVVAQLVPEVAVRWAVLAPAIQQVPETAAAQLVEAVPVQPVLAAVVGAVQGEESCAALAACLPAQAAKSVDVVDSVAGEEDFYQ
jgi:hypothetical protein